MSTIPPKAPVTPVPETRRPSAEGSELPNIYVNDRLDTELALSLDPDSLDPEMEYKWVNVDPRRVSRHRARGYRTVLHTEKGPKAILEGENAADGTIRVGDVLLMACPKALVKQRAAKHEALATKRRENEDRRVVSEGEKRGVKVINHNTW